MAKPARPSGPGSAMYAVGSTTCGRVPTAAADVSVSDPTCTITCSSPPQPDRPATHRHSQGSSERPTGESPAGVIRQAPDVRSVGRCDPGRASGARGRYAGSDLESAVMARAAANDSPARPGLVLIRRLWSRGNTRINGNHEWPMSSVIACAQTVTGFICNHREPAGR